MAVMVDSCVLLDIFSHDDAWYEWSSNAVARAADRGSIVLNPIIYSEISVRFRRIEDLETLLSPDIFEYRPIPREAAFLAGKCFLHYRQRGGKKTSPLPDFLIGAHAVIEDIPLITRAPKRFRQYYPGLQIICP